MKDGPPPGLEAWCDYLRGVADDDTAARCSEHIAASEGALDALGWMRRAIDVGRRDAEQPIPVSARRLVRALGSVRRPDPETEAGHWRRAPFRIRFDSLVAPATVGLRDAAIADLGTAAPRQLVVDGADLVVEVRVEEALRDGSAVVGQVVRRDDPALPVAGLPILVTAEGRVVAHTESDALGVFHCEGLPKAALVLTVVLDDESLLEVPLTGVRSGTDAAR
jgi:hypothetical protein